MAYDLILVSCLIVRQSPPLTFEGANLEDFSIDGKRGGSLQREPCWDIIRSLLPRYDHYPRQVSLAGLKVPHMSRKTLTASQDIFRTNRYDPNISDTSSYLDLAPLYGSSLEDQKKVRTMSKGLLKPDTFHEARLIGQPPVCSLAAYLCDRTDRCAQGINVMLVMYNRFHNYVADVLLKINEGGRFTLPPNSGDKGIEKQDNDLFQTARLLVHQLGGSLDVIG